jgi:hypothetical protein
VHVCDCFSLGTPPEVGISVYTRSSLISGNNTRVVFFASEFNSKGVKKFPKYFELFWATIRQITSYWGNMTSRKEYYASCRDASKVYQSVSISLFSRMESVPFLSDCVSPWYTYILKLLLKVFKKRIQEGLDISPNIAAIHPLHCGSFSEIACWSPLIEVLMTIKFSLLLF